MKFMKFEIKHFNRLDNATLRVLQDYYYSYGFWINLNLSFNKTYNTVILAVVAIK